MAVLGMVFGATLVYHPGYALGPVQQRPHARYGSEYGSSPSMSLAASDASHDLAASLPSSAALSCSMTSGPQRHTSLLKVVGCGTG